MILEGRVVIDCLFDYGKLNATRGRDGHQDRETRAYPCDNESREAQAPAPASQGLPGARRSPEESPLQDSEGPSSMQISRTRIARQCIALVLSPGPIVGLCPSSCVSGVQQGQLLFTVCVPRFSQM